MTLQGTDLVMSGLCVLGDRPPNTLQPRLIDGVHLRWAFPPERGFPWYGFYLFRREYRRQDAVRIKDALAGLGPGLQPTNTIATARSRITSDVNLQLTDLFPPGGDGDSELDLSGRNFVLVQLGAASQASELSVRLYSNVSSDTTVHVRLFLQQMPPWSEDVVVKARSEGVFRWKLDGITGIEFGTAPVVLVSLEFVPSGQGPSANWEKVPGIPYPVALPLTRPDYPATSGLPEDINAARITARDRVARNRYGDPDRFAPAARVAYSQGTIEVTKGSALVRGHGVQWDDSLVGCLLQVTGDATAYAIAAVLDVDRLTLTRAYEGATAAGCAYAAMLDPFGQLHDLLIHLVRGGPAANIPMSDRWLPAPIYEQGTLAVVEQSDRVDGTGTGWDGMLAGCLLQIDTKYGISAHRIVKVVSTTQVQIEPAFPSTSASGLTYRILPPLTLPEPSGSGVESAPQRPLDVALLGATQPPVAQMLGLYWVDQAADPAKAYDYLVVAARMAFPAVTGDKGDDFLAWLRSNPTGLDDPNLDAAIIFNRKLGPVAPLDKPTDLAAYALPTASFGAPGAAGLAWDLREHDTQALLPGTPALYHVLRAGLGLTEPAPSSAGAAAYDLVTADRPVLVLHSDPAGKQLPGRGDWPSTRLQYVEQGLDEGWYSYKICGVDLFGRYSPNSDPAPWREWSPPPAALPWYWGRPSAPIVHPFAVGLLDKMPPPPPTDVEAFALDPADPLVVKDSAYTSWWNGLVASAWYQALPADAQKALVGVRVRWLWTEAEALQAPDASEFRIYFKPGVWNAVFGQLASVAPVPGQPDRSTVTVQTAAPNTRGADAYKEASLRTATAAFPILASSAGDPLALTVKSGPVITAGKAGLQEGVSKVQGSGGTAWTKAVIGQVLQVNGEKATYRVLNLDVAAQEITLDRPYRGLGGSKSYSISGSLPRVGERCSVVIAEQQASYTYYQHPTAWAQRLAAVGYSQHFSPVLQPAADRNGVTLRGAAATLSGATVTLVDLPAGAVLAGMDLADSLRTLCLALTDAAGAAQTFRVLSIDPNAGTVALDGAPSLAGPPSGWLLGYPARRYEVFLPDPSHARPEGLQLAPGLADPVAYGSIGVSAADDKAHTPDNAAWHGTPWGDRTGNEGQVSAPATVFAVWRQPPDPPAIPVFDSDRLFATRADYHSRSFFTVRWAPAEHLKVHVFRALDESLYLADWGWRRARSPQFNLSAADVAYFPEELRKSDAATAARLGDAIQRINDLNNLNPTSTRDAVVATYSALTNDAKRVLANLPGNESAFMQLTVEPLDPHAPATANDRSPDDPDGFQLDDAAHPAWSSTLRRFVDTLDGRSGNAYFYRVGAVDGAYNRSKLSLSTPPVACPDVTPPGAPLILKALGGDRQVRLLWQAGPGPAPDEYRVFRTGDRALARDTRLMGAALLALPGEPLVVKGGELDIGVLEQVALAEKVYGAADFDPTLDLLTGQTAAQYLAVPQAVTGKKITGVTAPEGAQVVLVYRDTRQVLQYTPNGAGPCSWTDDGVVGATNYYYRIEAWRQGTTATGAIPLRSEASPAATARAYDLTPPQPPTVTLIEWVKVDSAGSVYPYAQPTPAGQARFAAVRLRWTSPDPELRCLVQFRSDPTGAFENASSWLPRGVYEVVHRNELHYVALEYRVKVVNLAGNNNVTFALTALAPQP